VIRSFASRETANLFSGRTLRRIAVDVQRRALIKLLALHAAGSLDELQRIPGNRLEKLRGDRVGQYSIRVNDQWRICFAWHDGDADDVDIVDYH
jgi:proteic killer suppression protein